MIGQRFPKPSLVRFYALKAVPQEFEGRRIIGFPQEASGTQETWFDSPKDGGHPTTVRRSKDGEGLAQKWGEKDPDNLVHRSTFDAVWDMASRPGFHPIAGWRYLYDGSTGAVAGARRHDRRARVEQIFHFTDDLITTPAPEPTTWRWVAHNVGEGEADTFKDAIHAADNHLVRNI